MGWALRETLNPQDLGWRWRLAYSTVGVLIACWPAMLLMGVTADVFDEPLLAVGYLWVLTQVGPMALVGVYFITWLAARKRRADHA